MDGAVGLDIGNGGRGGRDDDLIMSFRCTEIRTGSWCLRVEGAALSFLVR